jgi:ornithine cyclodeaminase
LKYIYQEALKRNVGIDIELVAVPEDPKDLMGHTRGGRASLRRVV